MLINAAKKNVCEYMDILYELALDPAKSCYPLFSDGISTKNDFYEHIEKGTGRNDRTSLFYTEEGVNKGLIQFFTIEEEKYLQLCGFYINGNIRTALKELLAYIELNYGEYDLYFGFPEENKTAAALLYETGFSLIENDNHNVMFFSEYKKMPQSEDIRRINAENYEDFRALHQVDGTTYWNSDRIRECLDKWNIYVLYENNRPTASVYETGGEIYGTDFKDGIYRGDAFAALVTRVLNQLKDRGCKSMTFFCEDETQQAALSLGFRFVGRYMLYYREQNGKNM